MKVERTRPLQTQRIERQKADVAKRVIVLPQRARNGNIAVQKVDNVDEVFIYFSGAWIQLSRNAEIDQAQSDIKTNQDNLQEGGRVIQELADMANIDTTLSFVVVEDLVAAFDATLLPDDYENIREDQENIIDISDGITGLGQPVTMTISTAEVTDTDDAVTEVGLSTSGNAGEGSASVTITPNADNQVDDLYLHITTADISGGNKNADIRVRLEQPD